MSLYLDSADLDDLRGAVELGFVRGVTTNPTLLRKVTAQPLAHLELVLGSITFDEIYYQPTGAYGDDQREALAAVALDRARVILKLPATTRGAALAAELSARGARVALTAAQSPAAMLVAEALGCHAVIPYVDRAARDVRTTDQLIAELARVRSGRTRIVAASVKHVGQAVAAFVDGADAVTAPLAVLRQLVDHPASREAEQAFDAEYRADDPIPLEAAAG